VFAKPILTQMLLRSKCSISCSGKQGLTAASTRPPIKLAAGYADLVERQTFEQVSCQSKVPSKIGGYMSLPTILGSGEGESVQIGGSVCTFKATGKDTRGHAGLFEFTMPPGAGASPHIHKELTEMFYVTEGEVELLLADKRVNASQGAFMLVPESTPHGFT